MRCCEEEVVAEAAVVGFYGEGLVFFIEAGFVGCEVGFGVLGRGFGGV